MSADVRWNPGTQYDKNVVKRLVDELDAMIKNAAFMREGFEHELVEFRGKPIPQGMMQKGKEMANIYDTVTTAKIRLDKALKSMADNMTPEEERAAVVVYIKSLSPDDRKFLMYDIRTWMRGRSEDVSSTL